MPEQGAGSGRQGSCLKTRTYEHYAVAGRTCMRRRQRARDQAATGRARGASAMGRAPSATGTTSAHSGRHGSLCPPQSQVTNVLSLLLRQLHRAFEVPRHLLFSYRLRLPPLLLAPACEVPKRAHAFPSRDKRAPQRCVKAARRGLLDGRSAVGHARLQLVTSSGPCPPPPRRPCSASRAPGR